jgi:hypothetical protein
MEYILKYKYLAGVVWGKTSLKIQSGNHSPGGATKFQKRNSGKKQKETREAGKPG